MSSMTTASDCSPARSPTTKADLEAVLDLAAQHGTSGLVVDQPGSIAQLALAVAARRGTPVAYVPGAVLHHVAWRMTSMPGR